MQNIQVSDVVYSVAVSFTFLNGERHACPYQTVQLVDLHAFVHKRSLLHPKSGRIRSTI